MMMHQERFSPDSLGQLVFQGDADEPWWCGLELELTLKSKARYQRQFKALREYVYDRINERQKIPLMLFLCGSSAIQDSLIKYQQERAEDFGRSLFVFCQIDRFLKDRRQAATVQYLGTKPREGVWEKINDVKMKVTS